MTDRAAFQGTYSDIKLIRSRKVAVVCVEIPIEAATAFVAAFGMPDPASETWVALARIENMQDDTPKPKRAFADLPLPQQAALACQREAFQRFAAESGWVGLEISEAGAAEFVREHCGVESRADLNATPAAARSWTQLYHDFQLWLNEPDA
jgi:hypothetical protein